MRRVDCTGARLMRRTFSASILFLLIALTASAQSGEWGSRGATRRFAVLGDLVFAADGRGVTTYDVSQPANIRVADFDTTGNETCDLAIVGGTPAHVVAATKRGLDWYRVEGASLVGPVAITESRDPVTLVAANAHLVAAVTGQNVSIYELRQEDARLIATFDFRNRVLAVAFVGDVLYVSVDREGTYVYELPSTEWTAKLLEAPVAFALAGSTLWGASRDTALTAIDVQNPAAPRVISGTGIGESFFDGVAAAGTRVFAFEKGNRLRVFDVSDPGHPLLVTTLEEWVNVIAASGNRLYLAGAIIDSEKLSSETGKPLRIFDAATLALLGERTDLAGPVSGVWTDGSVAYVVDPPYLRVLDISTTAQPRELSSILVPGIQDHIRVKNGVAVLYGRAAVNLLDVSAPLHPRFLGTWNTQGHPPSVAAIAGGTNFVEANNHSGFHIVDYSNPAAPVQIGGRKWHYHDVAASDDAVYLLLQGVFRTVQIANGKDAVDQAEFSLLADQLDIVPPNAPNPHTLVVRTPVGIRIYSLTDRFAPQQTAFVPIVEPGLMATGNGDAYITLDGVLHRMDVAAPAQPIATGMKVMSPLQISVAGAKVAIADRYSLRVYGPDTPSPLPPPPVTTKRRAVAK